MEDTYLLTMQCPVYRRRDSHSGSRTELETLIGDAKGKRTSGDPTRPKVPMRRSGSDCPIVVMKWGNAHGAKGAGHSRRDRGNWVWSGDSAICLQSVVPIEHKSTNAVSIFFRHLAPVVARLK